jgi:hypothetical protein
MEKLKREKCELMRILKTDLKQLEESICTLKREIENLDRVERRIAIEERIRRELGRGDLGWVGAAERKVLLNVWEAFASGLVSRQVLDKTVEKVAERLLRELAVKSR